MRTALATLAGSTFTTFLLLLAIITPGTLRVSSAGVIPFLAGLLFSVVCLAGRIVSFVTPSCGSGAFALWLPFFSLFVVLPAGCLFCC
jgi:hypothetical protein